MNKTVAISFLKKGYAINNGEYSFNLDFDDNGRVLVVYYIGQHYHEMTLAEFIDSSWLNNDNWSIEQLKEVA